LSRPSSVDESERNREQGKRKIAALSISRGVNLPRVWRRRASPHRREEPSRRRSSH
jgi:hypothetical protein